MLAYIEMSVSLLLCIVHCEQVIQTSQGNKILVPAGQQLVNSNGQLTMMASNPQPHQVVLQPLQQQQNIVIRPNVPALKQSAQVTLSSSSSSTSLSLLSSLVDPISTFSLSPPTPAPLSFLILFYFSLTLFHSYSLSLLHLYHYL